MALNRPSYSVSEWSDGYYMYPASNGNDGDKVNCNGMDVGVHSLAASAEAELNPWYSIDLGVKLAIAGVRFTHRSDTLYGGK